MRHWNGYEMNAGRIVLDELQEEGISINALGPPGPRQFASACLIVNGKRSITADTAMRRSRFFGTSVDLALVDPAVIEREVLPRTAA